MSNTIKPKPMWRIDTGTSDAESVTRQMARKMDQAGNRDGKVSMQEVDAMTNKLNGIMGSRDYSAWTDPTNDPVKKQAWVDRNMAYGVADELKNGHSLLADLAIKNFGGALEGAAALLWFGPSVWINGKKIGG
jgi:hypothetical protein